MNLGMRESRLSFRAFVAVSAMEAAGWSNAGKGFFQGAIPAEAHDVALVASGERPDDFHMSHPAAIERRLIGREEFVARIGKRIRTQGRQGKLADAMLLAPQRRLDRQQDVSPRQID